MRRRLERRASWARGLDPGDSKADVLLDGRAFSSTDQAGFGFGATENQMKEHLGHNLP